MGGGARWLPLLLLPLLLLLVPRGEAEPALLEAEEAEAWLRSYGYLPAAPRQPSTLRAARSLAAALAEMQAFYGIPVTGLLDQETRA
ncbi:matrix metalloproteinase-15-like [Notechis scutatus]|uniref:Matrix metalloproteinase-15-like n=1 Tax=Notechis scutatus TaxID=8663 RepID=A0A6J1VP44_9SAUR|nr:matrix metalloproteinase-15-like [Notechis scutatus]